MDYYTETKILQEKASLTKPSAAQFVEHEPPALGGPPHSVVPVLSWAGIQCHNCSNHWNRTLCPLAMNEPGQAMNEFYWPWLVGVMISSVYCHFISCPHTGLQCRQVLILLGLVRLHAAVLCSLAEVPVLAGSVLAPVAGLASATWAAAVQKYMLQVH